MPEVQVTSTRLFGLARQKVMSSQILQNEKMEFGLLDTTVFLISSVRYIR